MPRDLFQSPIVIVAGLAVLAVVIYLGVKAAQAQAERERRRLAGLGRWAGMNGFSFDLGDPWNLDNRYQGLADIGRGHARYAFETLIRESPVPAAIFRYTFRTWETRTVTRNGRTYTEQYEETHWRRYLVVELGVIFPHLFLRLEGLLDRIAGFVGFDDIDFESEEFSKRYFCKSDDRQFAYAVIHPQMMEWLMSRRYEGELRQGLLMMDATRGPHTPEGCQEVWENAVGFINRIPDFVWQDYAKHEPIKLPEPTPYVPPAPEAPPSLAAAPR
jgi:hypothetical protein